MRKIVFIFMILFLFSCTSVLAQNNTVDVYTFYGQGCPHCGKLSSFLEELEAKYSTLEVKEYEVYFNDENRELFQELSDAFGVEIQGVPTTFINGKVIVGFSSNLAVSLEEEIKKCLATDCLSPLEKLEDADKDDVVIITGDSSPTEDPGKTRTRQSLTLGAVIGAAAVDAINPCAFAVLIILLTTILSARKRKRVIGAGLAFTLSIYISYFLMGIGLYSAVRAADFTHIFYSIVAVLAILVGLFNLKDYLWYGKWFVMEVPMSWRPKMKMLIKSVTSIPGAFLIGFVISLFLLPCTSGPYIVILGLLAKATTRNTALLYLILYNFIFILPMLIITVAIGFGFATTAEAEEWRQKKLKVLHLIAGIIILLLGIGMLIVLGLGMV